MKQSFHAVLWVSFLLLGACSGTGEPESTEKNKALTNAVNEPLEKARSIERQVMEDAEATRRKIDEQAGQDGQ